MQECRKFCRAAVAGLAAVLMLACAGMEDTEYGHFTAHIVQAGKACCASEIKDGKHIIYQPEEKSGYGYMKYTAQDDGVYSFHLYNVKGSENKITQRCMRLKVDAEFIREGSGGEGKGIICSISTEEEIAELEKEGSTEAGKPEETVTMWMKKGEKLLIKSSRSVFYEITYHLDIRKEL